MSSDKTAPEPAARRLESPYAVLDAEVIRHEGFDFESKLLTQLRHHVAAKRIGILMSEVNVRELRKGIGDRVATARGALRNDEFRSKTAILRQVEPYRSLLRDVNQASVIGTLEARLDAFLRDAAVHEVPAGRADIGKILDQYFNKEAPFESAENKKAEFPDAISIHVLADFLMSIGSRSYFVSSDKGARRAASDTGVLIPLERLEELNELLAIAEADDMARVQRAEAAMNRVNSDVIARLTADFDNLGFTLTSEEEGEVLSVEVTNVTLAGVYVFEVRDDEADFTVDSEITYEAEVSFDDPGATFFSEGDRYVFNEIRGLATGTELITSTATVRFGADEEEAELIELDSDLPDTIEVPLDEFRKTSETNDDYSR